MAGQETPRYSNDERLTEAQREQYDAAHHALQRGGGSGSGDGGGGAAGAAMGSMVVVGTLAVFMLYACVYPVAAGVALVVGILVSKTFGFFVPGVGWVMHYLVALPLGFGALMMVREHEWRLELKPWYRRARHALRFVFTALIVSTTATLLGETDHSSPPPTDPPLDWTHFAIVAASLVTVHFVGGWLDRRALAQVADAGPGAEVPGQPARPRVAGRWRVPGTTLAPAPLATGLPLMALAGGAFGGFLGFAAFETPLATLVGLFAGSLAGALLMFVSWVVTRPVGVLFDRAPLLWPLLMGGMVGTGVAWRLALADKVSLAAYLPAGIIGGAAALAVPYLLYVAGRRVLAKAA